MRSKNADCYFAMRAREETKKVKEAINRGAHPAAVAAHGELAARYQAMALIQQQLDWPGQPSPRSRSCS